MENTTSEYKVVCRICLDKNGLLFSLFRKRGDGFSPYEKILRCTNVKIEIADSGPTCICSQCLSELDITAKFIDKCEQAKQYRKSAIQLDNLKPYCLEDESVDFVAKTDKNHEGCYRDDKQVVRSLLVSELLQCGECGSRRSCQHWSPPEQYKCEHCNNCFNRKSNYILHLKRHSGEREHPCPTCGAHFIMRSQALRHCQPKPRHICPLPGCGKSFTSVTNLRTHVHTHNGDRPYQCPVCGKQFTCKNTLNDHRRIHTGEKPYICAVCGKSFTTNKLSAHMRTHTGDKPHACQVAGCGKAFPTPRALARHAMTHAPRLQAYACTLCPARYNHSQSLNKHLRKLHGQKPKTLADRNTIRPIAIDQG